MFKPSIEERKAMRRLGSKIRVLRLEKGWTQRELGRRAGLEGVLIGRVERGERNPRVKTLCRIAEGLRCPVEEMLEGI